MAETEQQLRGLVAEVAAAYFSSSHVAPADIPDIIAKIAESLGGVGQPQAPLSAETADSPKATRAQIKRSIRPDVLISFEDGKGYRALKRHLTARGLTPGQYREKWGLPSDYPLVAPSYSAARSEFAKQFGLGQRVQARSKAASKGRRAAPPAPDPAKE